MLGEKIEEAEGFQIGNCHSTPPPLQVLDKIMKRLDELEAQIKNQQLPGRLVRDSHPHPQSCKCWECGKEGHLRHNCPLNEERPVWEGNSWPRK